jgi:hypothetical protein
MATKTKVTPPEERVQSEKFVEAARKLGADESEQRFDDALKRVGKAKLTHPPRPKKEAGEMENEDQ